MTVNGTVISSEDKSALPGVNVSEKGTENWTTTKSDGTFSITITDPNATRKAVVCHYYAEGALRFHDLTGSRSAVWHLPKQH